MVSRPFKNFKTPRVSFLQKPRCTNNNYYVELSPCLHFDSGELAITAKRVGGRVGWKEVGRGRREGGTEEGMEGERGTEGGREGGGREMEREREEGEGEGEGE